MKHLPLEVSIYLPAVERERLSVVKHESARRMSTALDLHRNTKARRLLLVLGIRHGGYGRRMVGATISTSYRTSNHSPLVASRDDRRRKRAARVPGPHVVLGQIVLVCRITGVARNGSGFDFSNYLSTRL